jgi:hypothetical protein
MKVQVGEIMSEPKTIEETYTIIFDEIDQFMESVYQENLFYEKVIEQLQDDTTLPDEVKDIAQSIRGADDILSRLENMKMLLKSIAFQNHNLVLFTEQEKEDFYVKVLLGVDPEVL